MKKIRSVLGPFSKIPQIYIDLRYSAFNILGFISSINKEYCLDYKHGHGAHRNEEK